MHLEYAGFPIENDWLYGGNKMKPEIINPWLNDKDNIIYEMLENNKNLECLECQLLNKQMFDEIESPFPETDQIYLHCKEYKNIKMGWLFQTDWPFWAANMRKNNHRKSMYS